MSDQPFDNITHDDEADALHQVSVMLTGTKVLQNQPGIVYSLQQQKAHPADAQAIDQFLQSLEAEKRVALARAGGEQIVLSDKERYALGQSGVPYKDVWYTEQDFARKATRRIMDSTDGKFRPVLTNDGRLQLDEHGQIQVTATPQQDDDSGSGWFDSVGSFFGHLGGAIWSGISTAGKDALHGLNKAYNFVQAGITGQYASSINPTIQDGSALDPSRTNGQDMVAAGYDPSSIWSTFAFGASGKAHSDLSQLNDTYGGDKVDTALRYLNDPEAYRTGIENDPNNYVTNSDGQPELTPEAKSKLLYLKSDEFETLARTINAHQATIGNDLANALGIDPIHHSSIYAATTLTTNLVASFFIDPSLVALKGLQAAKLASVGIDTLADTKAVNVLFRSGPWAKNIQRGWTRGIELGGQYREALAAGDISKAGVVAAQFRAELPGLEPIFENFTGGQHVYQGILFDEAGKPVERIVNGARMPVFKFGEDQGIRSMDDAADFLANRWGLLRLMNGRAATQAHLMPGALSAFGYRRLKGITAGWMTSRSAARAVASAENVIARASADPELAGKLIDDGILRRMTAESDDAVNFFDGYELTPKGAGVVKRNLRSTGDELGEGAGRWTPVAIAERMRQAGIRLSTLLPRNTAVNIEDPRSGDIIYKAAMQFLNRGEANTFRALWASASAGERKAIVHGLIDQLGHAAGLGKTETGLDILNRVKTGDEAYMASGHEIILDGENLAPFEGQTRTEWFLPSFQAMQKAADRIGLGEKTYGKAFNSTTADLIMSQWKIGALMKPSTVTRNVLEGWLRTILEGRAGDALKARAIATAKNKELWDRGYGVAERDQFIAHRGEVEGLEQLLQAGGLSTAQRANAYAQLREAKRAMETFHHSPIVQHLLATEAGDTELARSISNGSMLDGETLGRSRVGNWLANTAPLAVAGRAYRLLVGRHMDAEDIDALLTMHPHDLQLAMEGYGQQLLEAEMGFRNAAKQSSEIARAGYGPARLRFSINRAKQRGESVREKRSLYAEEGIKWTHQALDGTLGADRYATALAQRVNAMPETAQTVMRHLADRRGTPIGDVVSALERESKNTSFGKVYFEDPVNAPNVARRSATPEEAEVGKLDWANKVVEEYRYLLTGQNNEFAQELADFIETKGVAPDSDWINGNLTNDFRPEAALAPESMAMVPGGIQRTAEVLQDIEGGAYQWLVERPLQRTTSSPVFLANYAIARKGLNPVVEKLAEQGMSREASENLARELATRNAWVKTEQLIDDPGQKAQFDVIARNMFPFARATQAAIRRWSTGLWQNPVAARKMMLAYEGSVHSGLIYKNAYGEDSFTYPGSGVMNMALRGLAQVPGFQNVAAFPIAADMTGQVLMSVPGADNPFRMSMGPMVSIPFREVYTHVLPYMQAHLGINTVGAQEALAKVDELVNGRIGQGETWAQFVPTAVRRIYRAMDSDQRNSTLASAMKNSIAHLAAAGLLPAPDATARERQDFLAHLQTQVKSQLFLLAAFGLVAPAAPQLEENVEGANADFAWDLTATEQLDGEYKQILNEVQGDLGRATAIFTALHPDRVVYDASGDLKENFLAASGSTVSQSEATASGAYLPSTEETLHWLDRHVDFVHSYGNVAAYFLPTETGNHPFSDAAYKAQIEFGLRQRKTPEEFMRDIYVRHAESVFYPADHNLNSLIDQAHAQGNDSEVARLTAIKHDWQQQFKSLNPYFGDKLDDYGSARKAANDQLSNLRDMTERGQVPDGLGHKLGLLLKTYDNYQQILNDHQGQDDYSVAMRSHALSVFNQWADETLGSTPLANVFNGVFRVLNSNFDQI